jgi:hypothetical protein
VSEEQKNHKRDASTLQNKSQSEKLDYSLMFLPKQTGTRRKEHVYKPEPSEPTVSTSLQFPFEFHSDI